MITADRLRECVDYDPDTGLFTWRDRPLSHFKRAQSHAAWRATCFGKPFGSILSTGYRRAIIDGERYLEHRLAWFYVYGVWPEEQIDHLNGDRTDNRIANLRCVSNAENHRNLTLFRNNTSGVAGVRFDKRYGTWKAVIWDSGRPVHLGSFLRKDDAVAARRDAEMQLGYHPNHGKQRAA